MGFRILKPATDTFYEGCVWIYIPIAWEILSVVAYIYFKLEEVDENDINSYRRHNDNSV